jgi:hypothetical protein
MTCVDVQNLQIAAQKGPITSGDKKDPENVELTLPKTTKVVMIQEDRGEGRIKTKQTEKIAYIKFNKNKTTALQLIAALEKIAEGERQEVPEKLTPKEKAASKQAKKDKKKKKKEKKKEKKSKATSRSHSPKRKPAASEEEPKPSQFDAMMAGGTKESSSLEEEEESAGPEEYDIEEWVEGEEGMSVNDIETELQTGVVEFMKEGRIAPLGPVSNDRILDLVEAFNVWINTGDNMDPTTIDYLRKYQGRRNLQREVVEGYFAKQSRAFMPPPPSPRIEIGEFRDFLSLELNNFLEREHPHVSNAMVPRVYAALVEEFRAVLHRAMNARQAAFLRDHAYLMEDTLAARDIKPGKEAAPVISLVESEEEEEEEESGSDIIMPSGSAIKIQDIVEQLQFEVLPLYLVGYLTGPVSDEDKMDLYEKIKELYDNQTLAGVTPAYWDAIEYYKSQQPAGFGRNFLDDAWEQLWDARDE